MEFLLQINLLYITLLCFKILFVLKPFMTFFMLYDCVTCNNDIYGYSVTFVTLHHTSLSKFKI